MSDAKGWRFVIEIEPPAMKDAAVVIRSIADPAVTSGPVLEHEGKVLDDHRLRWICFDPVEHCRSRGLCRSGGGLGIDEHRILLGIAAAAL